MNTKMEMSYEFITPEIATQMLEANGGNRSISNGTVKAYAQDILNNNWDETVGTAISIDEKGILRDGQHRLSAIIKAGKGIHTWVCRNVSEVGIYDNNRKRSSADQIAIIRPDFEKVYRTNRYIAVARALITNRRRTITPKEIIDFTEEHKKDLDKFFLIFPQHNIPKVSVAVVHLALFAAFMNGVDMKKILSFYDVLSTGMSTDSKEFPIIAYRNYLKDSFLNNAPTTTIAEIGKCQYALKKYLTGSCTKKNIAPKELIYKLPWQKKENDYE